MQLKSHRTVEQIAKKHRLDISFVKNQLQMGIPIEHEHTRNKILATDIALQHLDEIPDYYTRLKKMEASAKNEHKKFKDVKEDAVTDLQRGVTELPDASYGSINSLMRRIMKKRKMTAKQLHNDFVDKHNQTPDTWAKKNMKEETGLWDNIHARREKGLPRKKPGQKGYPKTLKIEEGLKQSRKNVGASKCWTGKVATKTKMKDGEEVPDCHSIKEESEVRYCPKCAKEETRDECKYGQKYWDMFSMPITLKDYTPNTPHPGNMPEETTIEDVNGNTFLRITDIIRADRLVKEGIFDDNTIRQGSGLSGQPTERLIKLQQANPGAIDKIQRELDRRSGHSGVSLPLAKAKAKAKAKTKSNMQVAHYIPKTFGEFMSEASPAWQRKVGKNPEGGLNKKGISSYRKEHPGSHLSLAVTTEPSKLKKGSKKANRRKSFCSRMSGMKAKLTSAKTANDPNSRINKSLRKWNC
jgi:hypothetical protein